jgi:uncharacterized protein YecT (DUF1311 family)
MKRVSVFVALLIFVSFSAQSQSQTEMTQESYDSYAKADKELNDVYKEILEKYKSDTLFIKNLKTAQRIWISFRNAELDMKFPDYGPDWYGSMHPMCIAGYLEELTKERIKNLRKWLEGRVQGNGCNGSIMD